MSVDKGRKPGSVSPKTKRSGCDPADHSPGGPCFPLSAAPATPLDRPSLWVVELAGGLGPCPWIGLPLLRPFFDFMTILPQHQYSVLLAQTAAQLWGSVPPSPAREGHWAFQAANCAKVARMILAECGVAEAPDAPGAPAPPTARRRQLSRVGGPSYQTLPVLLVPRAPERR